TYPGGCIMSATSLPLSSNLASDTTVPLGRLLWAYYVEAKYEFVRMLRTPAFSIPFLTLPVLLLLLFGVLLFGSAIRGNQDAGKFLFTGFSILGMMGPGMFGFGMGVAIEREQGLLKLKRALPMPPAAYLLAKMFMSMLCGVIVMATMVAAGLTLVHISLSFVQVLKVVTACIIGTLPFSAIGLFIGVWTTGRSASAFVNLTYQIMMHLSGLFYPLPKFMQTIAPMWPTYHLQQLVMNILGAPSRGSTMGHVAALTGVTVVLTLLALRRLKRNG
ncbi:MAG TPA: ABC transporter permease, partial [Candidatus Angelobacter sp.]